MEHAYEKEQLHEHVVPYKTYWIVWLALLGLTALTVYASYIDFGDLKTVVAVAIATAKATLVLLFFMHLLYDAPVFRWLFLVTIVMYVIFIAGTYADYMARTPGGLS